MRESVLKKYALFVSLLLFLSECRGQYDAQHDYVVQENDLWTPNDYFEKAENLESKENNILHAPRHQDVAKEPPKGQNYPVRRKSKRYMAIALITATLITAGFNIYKAAAGCAHFGGANIKRNMELAKRLNKDFMEAKKQVNLDYAHVYGQQMYLSKLETNMKDVEQEILKTDQLKDSIVRLIDVDIQRKFELVRKKATDLLLNLNETSFVDPEVYREQTQSAGQVAQTLATKMAPLRAWIGYKGISGLIRQYADKYVDSSSKTFSRAMKNSNLKHLSKVKFTKVAKTWMKIVKMFKVGSFIKTKLRIKIKSTQLSANAAKFKSHMIKGAAVAATVALVAAFEIIKFFDFKSDCEVRERKSAEMVEDYKQSLRNISFTKGNMSEMLNAVKQSYNNSLQFFISGNITLFVKDAIKTAEKSREYSSLIQASISEMKYFLDTINTTWNSQNPFIDKTQVEKSIKSLLDGFKKLNFQFTCVSNKIKMISSMTRSCAKGLNTTENIWKEAKKEFSGVLKDCSENKENLTVQGVFKTLSDSMEALGRNKKCILNNDLKYQLICSKWRKDIPIIYIAKADKMLTIQDVQTFISECPLANVTDTLAKEICELKGSIEQNLGKVLIKYAKYRPEQTINVWKNCEITGMQLKSLCGYKKHGFQVDIIAKQYPNFSRQQVEKAFSSCVTKLTNPNVKAMLCRFYGYSNRNINHRMFWRFTKLFGEQQILNYVTSKECNTGQKKEK